MPSLVDAIRPASGTRINGSEIPQAQPNKPDISTQPSTLQWTRSPVPPISISPDSVNMFQNSGLVPQDRIMSVLPLFTDPSSTGNTTITNITSGNSSSGSSSSSTIVTPPVSSASTAIITPVLSQGIPYQTSLQVARSFVLLSVTVSTPARVEFYSTANARSSDASRTTDQPVVLGAPTGLIADLNLVQPSEASWPLSPPAVGTNADVPTTGTVYVTVTNQTATSLPITVSITYFPLED